ncbi:hypothetical protein OEZ86_000780 [Tetradesmus obliquus]|nr:hypothetical protein OEZ86_000780 [Tetradesmus obliquus]
MACSCNSEGTRTVLWVCWTTNFLITSIFYILSFATCANLVKSYKLLNIEISNEIWRAPVAASLLGGLLVLLFNIASCAILVKKTVSKGGPGLGYGFVCAFCFTLAFFCLLCGLVLDGFKDVVRDQLQMKLPDSWSSVNMGTYLGTIGFAYLCFVMFILFFFALVVFQGAVTQELGLPPVRAMNPYAKMQGDMLLNPYAVGMEDPAVMMMAQQGMMVPPYAMGMGMQQGINPFMKAAPPAAASAAAPEPAPAQLAADPAGAL